jgi:hypothetical protein
MGRFLARKNNLTVLLAGAMLLAAVPALAQFGSIFSDPPPRPPGSVPGGQRQAPPPADLGRGGDVQSGVEVRRPPPQQWRNPDLPPSEPLASPMSLPPSSRPGGGTIQEQQLAPPPGAQSAPARPQQEPQQGAPQPIQPQDNAAVPPGQLQPGQLPVVRPRGAQQPADTSPQPGDEVVVEPPPQRIANPTAVFSGLDKITGRIIKFDVAINETVQFGALQVTPRVCYSRPPTETPNTDGFVEVDEVTLQGDIKRIFSGWMFAASPGLHAVEHPIYDVWITDCKGGQNPNVAEAPAEPQAKKPPAPARQPQARPRAQQPPSAIR